MKLIKTLGALFLSSTLGLGCWNFRDNTLEISRQNEIKKLPLNSTYGHTADMNNNGLEDCIVAGPLIGEPQKTAIFLLENKKTHYEPKLLYDEIPLRNPSFALRDVNNDGLKDIVISGKSLSEKRRTHWKHFNLINKGNFYVLE
ncbi:MAG: VCBS repeat-containing protein [Nanoarchaeota archaeon]|nr:VCBS repeat-containing protein [Nanoarchaeota archaeon]MBU4242625.1 VCBS repeat-containing protein [Nanoarchaeota archaeon]MBU4352803.1 VCBS repeat-containing protein [Nanoarchaeota archaeon]MCG2719149.1 VCBS repeat-containing protein [Nanoarchaeota archaeon]